MNNSWITFNISGKRDYMGDLVFPGLIEDEGNRCAAGGEMSGHLFFGDRYFGFDDAVYAGCQLIEILRDDSKRLSAYFTGLPKTFVTPEIRIDCPDTLKFTIVDRCRIHFSRKYKTIDIDGDRILFNGGWGLIRASNTQPALVLRFEANDPELLTAIESQVHEVIIDSLS